MEEVLFLVRSAPYGTASSGEAYRAMIGLSGMGIPTTVVLMCDGVFNAIKGQEPQDLDMHPIEQAYKNAVDFDVELLILDHSLDERSISGDDIIEEAKVINCDQLKELIDTKDCVISFS